MNLLLRQRIRHPVAKNILALYGVQIANYLLPLVTIPYLARVLRPEGLGLVLFAQSFALWGSLLIEYGFNLSASRDIARHRADPERVAQIVADVLGAKRVLGPATLALALIVGLLTPTFQRHPEFLTWAILYIVAAGLSPFWYFLGTERPTRAVAVEVLSRTLATIAIFLLVKNPADAWKVLAFQAMSGFLSTGITLAWIYREVPWRWPRWSQSFPALRQGWGMFLYCGAMNIYATGNTYLLGLFAAERFVGYYGGAEKIAKAVLGLLWPISQALYPRMASLMVHDPLKARYWARASFIVMGAFGLVLFGIIEFSAQWLTKVILGRGYGHAAVTLHILALLVPINALSNALTLQWMLPRGLERTVSLSILVAGAVDVILAVVLAPRYAHVGMAWAVVAAGSCMLLVLTLSLLFQRTRQHVQQVG